MSCLTAVRSKISLKDVFQTDLPPGGVVGGESADGVIRRGADAEGKISIDAGALRIGYIARPGWGRHGIAYGPFPRENGLGLAVFILNGHNGSQTLDSFRFKDYLRGIVRKTLGRLPDSLFPRPVLKKIHPEIPHYANWPPVRENLAVGWFPFEIPRNAAGSGEAFVVRATGIENGEVAVRAGDTAAFEPLVRKHQARIFGIARRYARRESEVEDIVQEVFLKAYRKLHTYHGEAPFEHWLSRIATNTAIDFLRRHGRVNFCEVDELAEPLTAPARETPEQLLLRSEQHGFLEDGLQQLTVRERTAIVLRDIEGLPAGEVARRLNCSKATVRSHIANARIKIRRHLERRRV